MLRTPRSLASLSREGEEFEPLKLEAVGFDPAYLSQFADDLESDGLPMVEIPQTDSRMVPGFQMLYELLTDGRLQHDGDETLARHVLNSTVRWARNGTGQRLDRPKGERRPNDAAIALVMCTYLLMKPEPKQPVGIQLWV